MLSAKEEEKRSRITNNGEEEMEKIIKLSLEEYEKEKEEKKRYC